MIKPGDAAPDFVLKDEAGKDLRLSSFSGRTIVLYFYPRDFTPGCTLEAKGFRDHYETISGHGAVVVGVSLDGPERHRAFHDQCRLPFHLLADPDGRVHDLYDAWRTSLLGRTHWAMRRCTFVIDGDGIVREVHRNVSPIGHARQVVKDLERLAAQQAWGKNGAAKPKKAGKAS